MGLGQQGQQAMVIFVKTTGLVAMIVMVMGMRIAVSCNIDRDQTHIMMQIRILTH